MLRILIADDHFIVLAGIKILLKEAIDQEYTLDMVSGGKELLKALNTTIYDILITDLNMPDTISTSIVKQVTSIQPQIKILVLSVNSRETFAKYCFFDGVYGYIQKGIDDNYFKEAIKCLVSNKKYTKGISINFLEKKDGFSNPFDKLSSREFEVAVLLLKGNGLLEISNILNISISTASTYKRRVFDKLKIINTMELNHLSKQYGITMF